MTSPTILQELWEQKGRTTFKGIVALRAFEDSVYSNFSSLPPPAELTLLTRDRDERSLLHPEGTKVSGDDEVVVNTLAWLPWPRVSLFRLTRLQDNFLSTQSVEAQIYYAPAYMLHALALRGTDALDVLDLFLPADDAVVLVALSSVRSEAIQAEPDYNAYYKARADQFRRGFSPAQASVIQRFLDLWISWSASTTPHPDAQMQRWTPAIEALHKYWGQGEGGAAES